MRGLLAGAPGRSRRGGRMAAAARPHLRARGPGRRPGDVPGAAGGRGAAVHLLPAGARRRTRLARGRRRSSAAPRALGYAAMRVAMEDDVRARPSVDAALAGGGRPAPRTDARGVGPPTRAGGPDRARALARARHLRARGSCWSTASSRPRCCATSSRCWQSRCCCCTRVMGALLVRRVPIPTWAGWRLAAVVGAARPRPGADLPAFRQEDWRSLLGGGARPSPARPCWRSPALELVRTATAAHAIGPRNRYVSLEAHLREDRTLLHEVAGTRRRHHRGVPVAVGCPRGSAPQPSASGSRSC